MCILAAQLSYFATEMQHRKVLIVTNRVPYPLKDGGNLAMQAMIEGYHKAGWQVYLLSMNTSRHHISRDQLQKLFMHLYRFEWVEFNNNLKWTDIIKNFLFSKEPEHAMRYYSDDFKDKLKEVLTSFNPDVVQVESVYLSTYLPVIKQNSHAVSVLRLHNVEYQIWQSLSKKHKNRFKQIYFNSLTERIRNFERNAWTGYDLLLPITEKDAYLVERLEEVKNIIIAPFSIDIENVKQGNSQEKWVGYHIGAMDWIPNKEGILWFLNRAWPKIHRSLPSFEFYFAGRKMPDEFMNLNIPGIHCMNEVPDADEFIADKKILIVPLWSGGGIRVKILEAMAAGKVVITTSNGIKGIEANPGEHYLLVRKPEEFERAIKWCLENKPAAEKMAENARQLVREKYNQSKVIREVIGELELLLGTSRIGR
jgi:glycosyltransferase involved in cell wall biosynthesis